MLKLLKYELIHSWRTFGMVYMSFLLICFIIPFTNPMHANNIIANFLLFVLIILTFGISISILVSIAVTFNKSMFKKPGYLTLTLPVSTHQLILSKLIANLIWIFISGWVLFLGFFMMALLLGITAGGLTFSWNDLMELFGLLRYIDLKTWYEIFIVFITIEVASMMSLLLIYLSITVTHTKFITRFKTGVALIFYFIVNYLASSTMTGISEAVFNPMTQHWTTQLYLVLAITAVFAAIFYFATVYIIDHKLEVE